VVAAEAAKAEAEKAVALATDVWAEVSSKRNLLALLVEQQELLVDQDKKLQVMSQELTNVRHYQCLLNAGHGTKEKPIPKARPAGQPPGSSDVEEEALSVALRSACRLGSTRGRLKLDAYDKVEIQEILRKKYTPDEIKERSEKLMDQVWASDAPDRGELMNALRLEMSDELRKELLEMAEAWESTEEQTARRREGELTDKRVRVKQLQVQLSCLHSHLLQPLKDMRDAVAAAAKNARRDEVICHGINTENTENLAPWLHAWVNTCADNWDELVEDVEALFARWERPIIPPSWNWSTAAAVHLANRNFTALVELYQRMGFISADDAATIAAALAEALPDVHEAFDEE